eukprot:m.40858 g.40858  ORF g.40858 m.40858 type:complete len:1102 (-) comp9716_c0_seq1:114-3419(-)
MSSRRTAVPASPKVAKRTVAKKGTSRLGDGKTKVTKHVDAKVAARNSALNAMGGVKVDVFVRVRPQLSMEEKDEISVTVHQEEQKIDLMDDKGHSNEFAYDKVYGPEATQEKVYEDAVAPIVEQVSRGLSCAIFAYGQTGSGKTHTMRGNLKSKEDHGIIQRSLENLFRRLNEQDYANIKVKVSFLEIYNEELQDLLEPPPKKGQRQVSDKSLKLIDHNTRGTVCHGLKEIEVTSVDDALKLLATAEANSSFSATKMNKLSNRAHRIFTIISEFKRYETDVISTLTFIDLAGSEDISRSGAEGLTAREAMYINKSLLTLGRVINALACNEKHIPYRDSKLTRLLSEALGGVCKTSFIACISPCRTSNTETNSTLRYAERAMEALNISQLPRWKQDEIMIDGLTRRVQQLMRDLEQQDLVHREEMQELKTANSALEKENNSLRSQIRRLNYKIDKLILRKVELKGGLKIVTNQRDEYKTQKEQLREELLETRMERDGYLNDRAILNSVLASVRLMRNRLLEAHNKTEASLTTDANELKRVLLGAIEDIDDLHTEVARKKALSVHNEKAADEYRDRLSEKIRTVQQALLEFRSGQDTLHNELGDMLTAMRGKNQEDTSQNRANLTSLSGRTSEILSNINAHAGETEKALVSRISVRRADTDKYRNSVAHTVTKFRTAVTSQLDQLRSQASSLEDNLQEWHTKIKSKLDERTRDVQKFSSLVNTSLSGMQASLDSATAKQLEMLESHTQNLSNHLESEKSTLTSESNLLIKDIQQYVNRVVAEFATKTSRRTESAMSNMIQATNETSQAVQSHVTEQSRQMRQLEASNDDWMQESSKSLEQGITTNQASFKSSSNLRQAVVDTSKQGESELNTGATQVDTMANDFMKQTELSCSSDQKYTEQRRNDVNKIASNASANLSEETEKVRTDLQKQSQDNGTDTNDLKEKMTAKQTEIYTNNEHINDNMIDVEADTQQYVMQEIKRDTIQAPAKEEYKFPTDYKKTDPYASILSDLPTEWEREANITEQKLQPGKGPDYPGELGAEDPSGLYSETKDRVIPEQESNAVHNAARESEAEEYETLDTPIGSPTRFQKIGTVEEGDVVSNL